MRHEAGAPALSVPEPVRSLSRPGLGPVPVAGSVGVLRRLVWCAGRWWTGRSGGTGGPGAWRSSGRSVRRVGGCSRSSSRPCRVRPLAGGRRPVRVRCGCSRSSPRPYRGRSGAAEPWSAGALWLFAQFLAPLSGRSGAAALSRAGARGLLAQFPAPLWGTPERDGADETGPTWSCPGPDRTRAGARPGPGRGRGRGEAGVGERGRCGPCQGSGTGRAPSGARGTARTATDEPRGTDDRKAPRRRPRGAAEGAAEGAGRQGTRVRDPVYAGRGAGPGYAGRSTGPAYPGTRGVSGSGPRRPPWRTSRPGRPTAHPPRRCPRPARPSP